MDFLVSSAPETGVNDRSYIKVTLGQKYKVSRSYDLKRRPLFTPCEGLT